MSAIFSPRWLMLSVIVLLCLGGLLIVTNLPTPPKSGVGSIQIATITLAPGVTIISITRTPTETPISTPKRRPAIGPPATNAGFTIATPEFATNVPLPLTKNFDTAQLTVGRAVYTQWCATCHGDRGQGLDEWRSSWDPAHQNCTQAGCHGAKHYPDGFSMLKVPPALIGPTSLGAFQNTQQLFLFIRALMPYQAPGIFSDDEYWAVTAFLADQHNANAGGQILSDANGANVMLH